jgi:hypothetical protein
MTDEGTKVDVPAAAAMLQQWAYDLLRENGWTCYNSTMLCGADGRKYVYPYVKDDSEVVGKGPTPLHALTEVIRQIHAQPAKELHGDDLPINEVPKVKPAKETETYGLSHVWEQWIKLPDSIRDKSPVICSDIHYSGKFIGVTLLQFVDKLITYLEGIVYPDGKVDHFKYRREVCGGTRHRYRIPNVADCVDETRLAAIVAAVNAIQPAQPAKVEASGATNPSDDELDIGWKITIQSGSMDVWIQHDNKNKHVLMVIEERPGGDIPVGFVSLDIRGLVELRKAIDAAIDRIKEVERGE